NGFKRLMKGMNCVDAHYNYVPTFAGPGHASIYTGFTPSENGIVGNAWYSREDKEVINCVGDSKVKTVGSDSKYGLYSPKNLQKSTMMEMLTTATKGKSVSVSFKNRGAILPAGKTSDGVFWFDYTNGNFITSSHYAEKLPEWAEKFNKQKIVDAYVDSTWRTYYPIDTYKKGRTDDNNFEVALNHGKPVFPYNMKELSKDKNLYELFSFTPWANQFLLNFAMEAIIAEGLGKDEQTDFLNISISSTDIAGHMFGPYSIEIEDMYIRLDQSLEQLFMVLDQQVGEENYVIFLTADHGVVSNPDYLKDQGKQGGFVEITALKDRLEADYLRKFKANGFITEIKNNNIYFNEKALKARKLSMQKVLFETKQFLLKQEGIEVVFERDSLMQNEQKDHKAKMVKMGVNERSGEMIFLTKHGYLPIDKKASEYRGTSHGSVWEYDTHVPLLFYGNGIPTGIRKEKTEITDVAPTILNYLNIQTGDLPGTKIKLK
ncbi:MAG: alkaline phosphatase family protein, partial [Crocinitomicaceae bacterium]|nr:alkaline phosphatase family protein [Crocinitomicaceae bacterium]